MLPQDGNTLVPEKERPLDNAKCIHSDGLHGQCAPAIPCSILLGGQRAVAELSQWWPCSGHTVLSHCAGSKTKEG